MSNPTLQIFPDAQTLYTAAAEQFVARASEALAARGRFVVALSGGNSPRPVYQLLASDAYAARVDWSRVHIFFGDERCVPPDDARSNYRMGRETLLDRVPLPASNIHRVRGEADPFTAALAYEQELRAVFRTTTVPALDLILLGMGDNGHTASLFPGTAALREQTRWVVAQYVEVVNMWRITFTPPLLNAARSVTFLVEGAAKAEMLWRVLSGPYQPDVLPAQLIQPTHGQLQWLVDAAAAANLETYSRPHP
jgi:6-phosphogluconolactonase